MKRALLACAVLASCSSPAPAVRVGPTLTTTPEPTSTSTSSTTRTTSTTSTTSAPTTTVPPAEGVGAVGQSPQTRPATAPSAPTTAVDPDDMPSPQGRSTRGVGEPPEFWYRLATCESGNGELSANQFQFMGGTAEKVGYYPGASYEAQRAMAQDWAARLRAQGTSPGSRAGWPECWWIAGGS